MPAALPSWLTVNHDPVGSFIKSYQIGASIGEAQSRLAEQQRQANMDLIAKREAMQENILKAQQELALDQAYKSQMISLEKSKLDEAAQQNRMAAIQAAATLQERQQYHDASIEQQKAKIAAQQARTIALQGQEKVYQGPNGQFFRVNNGAVEEIRPPNKKITDLTPQQALNLVNTAEKRTGLAMSHGQPTVDYLVEYSKSAIPTNAVGGSGIPVPASSPKDWGTKKPDASLKVGDIYKGFKYIGGDPNAKASWQKL